ncbi:MAG: PAS domain S-box protein [Syntrophales bacterium]|nr:PAS domain S-box protein [Syntrophales bacterium]
MKISKIIRSVYECTSPEEGIASVQNRLFKNRFLVVMDGDEFRGVVTADDIVQSPYQLIEDCLSPKPRLESTDSIESVLANMRETGSFVLPVFEDGKFIGVIVETDIIESLIEHRDKLTKTIVEKNDDVSRIDALLYSESEKLKAVQEDKKRTEDMLSLITANMSDMIVLTDTNGILQYHSPSNRIVLGYALKETVGKSVFDFVHPEDMERVECIFKNAVATSTPGRAEYRVRHADGHYIWVETIGNFAKDENGRVQGIILTSRDMTEWKQVKEALKEANAYNRSLIEASLDPLFTISHDGKITDVNTATERVTGYTRDAMVGTDFSNYFSDPEGARAGYCQVFTEGHVRDYPLEIRHRDGHVTPVLYNATIYHNKKGEVSGIFAAARDITERKQAEGELERHLKHLESMVKERTVELETKNMNLQELNTVLKVLLRQRVDDKKDVEEKFVMNVRNLVVPFVEQMKKGSLDVGQRLNLDIIEAHLHNIATPLLKNIRQFNLTPQEIKVAVLVKDGKPTKEIAEILRIATGSIDIHRKNIRKKLGLSNKKANLQLYLENLEQ